MIKKILEIISKALGLSGFGFILGAVVAGNIANGADIISAIIFGLVLLALSAAAYFFCSQISDQPKSFYHVVFPDP